MRNQKIPKDIWMINIMGLLCNVSSSLVFGVFSSFLRINMGVNVANLGFIQEIMEAFSFLTKLSAGFLSDFFRRRKTGSFEK